MPIEVAEELWQQLGFPHAADDDVAFTKEDLKALERTHELISLGILTPESQAALVRTWGRSFARLAEWQVSLLAELAIEDEDPQGRLDRADGRWCSPGSRSCRPTSGAATWRAPPAGCSAQVADEGPGTTSTMAVGFVDIVGYTGQSKNLSDADLVEWVEYFEDEMTRTVVDLGGRVIKTIGDEVLFVADDPVAAAEVALIVTERGEDEEDRFPRVRAGIAYGEVVSRLGDVYGPTVNIASRLTSVARPGSVLVDRGPTRSCPGRSPRTRSRRPSCPPPTSRCGCRRSSTGRPTSWPSSRRTPRPATTASGACRRKSVKGYSRLEPWVLRRSKGAQGKTG